MNLLEENIGEILRVIGIGDNALGNIPKAEATQAKVSEWDYIKLEAFS